MKSEAIELIRPNAAWILRGNELEWLDENVPKPTEEEINNAIQKIKQIKKIKELKEIYNEENEKDIEYLDTKFQADEYSKNLIVSVLSAGSVPSDFFWMDSYNNKVPMTFTELQGLSKAILERGQLNFIKLQELKKQVEAAISEDELNSINW